MSQFNKYIEIISEGKNKSQAEYEPKQYSPGAVISGEKLSHSITVSLGIYANKIDDIKTLLKKEVQQNKDDVENHILFLDNRYKELALKFPKQANKIKKDIEKEKKEYRKAYILGMQELQKKIKPIFHFLNGEISGQEKKLLTVI